MPPLLVTFKGGETGSWRVERLDTVRGAPLPSVARVEVIEGSEGEGVGTHGGWLLRGVTSFERYVNSAEHEALAACQPALGRPEATRAALIPIAKSADWYDLPQDERRRIFEERSHHISTGLEYLPAVARRLHHGRELGEVFDFLTWFEYAPENQAAFEDLVRRLRSTEEWTYVVREIDVRLVFEDSSSSRSRNHSN